MINANDINTLLLKTRHSTKIIEQYFDNLRVEFDCILSKNRELPTSIIDKLNQAFDETPLTWHNAYKIEKYLSYLCDEEILDADLKRSLLLYKKHFSNIEYKYYQCELEEIIKNNENIEEKRSLLLRLQSEMHAFYVNRSEMREYGFLTRIRVAFLFLIGLFFFLISLIYCFYFDHLDTSSEMIILVISSGFFGASFSMLVGLKSQMAMASMEDLKILHRQGYLLKRSFIGVGGALMTYFLIQSGFLSFLVNDSLIPILPVEEIEKNTYRNISLLIIWSFVAGFSEMLVPSLLSGIEKRINISQEGNPTEKRESKVEF